jgi:prepilin-type N-terminal cleavage/methylation domain-containing protein
MMRATGTTYAANGPHHPRQRGFTLVEILIALVIFASLLFGMAELAATYATSIRTTNTGQQTKVFGQAVQKYVSDQRANIASIATATTPVLIQLATLRSANYLSSGFSATNAYGQTICALVLQPTPGQLNAIVVTEGGTAINDFDLGDVAAAIGAAGGGLYRANPSRLIGALGGWSFSAGSYANMNNVRQHCNGSTGAITFAAGYPVMALWFTDFDTTSGLLYRNQVPGQPALNQMTTPIVMSALQAAGTACTTPGAIAQNTTQTSLVLCGVNNLWNVVGNTVPNIANGAPCTTSGQLGSDANNVAFTCNGIFWSPTTMPSANYNNATPTGCSVNNQISTSLATQELLVCRNNFWVRLANLIPSNGQLQTGQVTVSSGSFVAAPVCDWGGRTWFTFEAVTTGVDISVAPPRSTLKFIATPTVSPSPGWNISIVVINTAATSFDASYLNLQEIFHFGCSY